MQRIIEQIRELTDFKPRVGIILGSGWSEAVSQIEKPVIIEYSSLDGMPTCGVKGHAGRFVLGNLSGTDVIAMQGRFHLYEGRKPSETVLPIEVMKGLGIDKLIVTNAAGGINKKFRVGDIMVIDDHINLSGENPLVGIADREEYPRFADMTDCYNKVLSDKVYRAISAQNGRTSRGVYCQLKGPSYETKAEISMLSVIGCDAVGMSTATEVVYANYLKIKTVGISCITNMAAGISGGNLNHAEVLQVTKDNGAVLKSALICALNAIKDSD